MLSVRLRLFSLVSLLSLSSAHFVAAAPVVSGQIADQTIYDSTPAKEIDLTTKFSDPTLPSNTVRMQTILGPIDVTLYDQKTPITVDNFLHYIDSGAYYPTDIVTDEPAPLFFHRSLADFVIQSGGYAATQDPLDPPYIFPTTVVEFSPIQNEARPDLHNVRGTIGMAKLPDDPDSATSQWYINLADNSENLDNQNGGFTVFGTISPSGMATADAIADLQTFDASGVYGEAFTDLPLRNYSSSDPNLPKEENFAVISSMTPPLIFSAASDNANIASVSVISNDLFVLGQNAGIATITVTATDANGATASQSFDVTVEATPVHAANISTRIQVGTGEDALIAGFIVLGDAAKTIVIRAIGPSLAPDIPNPLSNPTLELHDATGAVIASNDDWENAPNKRDLVSSGFAPSNSAEAAILTTIPATSAGSAYTAVVRNADGTNGIGVVEVYDLDAGPGSSLLNISTRGNVQTGDNLMIGGFIISGEGAQRVLVRALGPSLADVGVSDPLADPTLTLVDSQGNEIDFNDDWVDSPVADEIDATTIPPNDPNESAVLQTLLPGAYTAVVAGVANTTGTGLVEVYALTN